MLVKACSVFMLKLETDSLLFCILRGVTNLFLFLYAQSTRTYRHMRANIALNALIL